MRPVLFYLGRWPVYSYGFMLCCAFFLGAFLLRRELERKAMEKAHVGPILLIAIGLGLAGAILLGAFERWIEHLRNPWHPPVWGGAACLGGFILATVASYIYARARGLVVLRLFDAAAPELMLGYAIARIGCQLSGDGDYGTPTTLPWGMSYPRGTVPTLEIVHPTPIYETLAALAAFSILWKLRRQPARDGWLFSVYLLFSGGDRFLVEFIRRSPKLLVGLSQAQLLSAALLAIGLVGCWKLRIKKDNRTIRVGPQQLRQQHWIK